MSGEEDIGKRGEEKGELERKGENLDQFWKFTSKISMKTVFILFLNYDDFHRESLKFPWNFQDKPIIRKKMRKHKYTSHWHKGFL